MAAGPGGRGWWGAGQARRSYDFSRRDGRADEGGSLENCWARSTGPVGSNPTPSARSQWMSGVSRVGLAVDAGTMQWVAGQSATELLPSLSSDEPCHGLDSRLLHLREDMAVGIERQTDARVSEHLTHDLGMDPSFQCQGRPSVPKIVKPDARLTGFTRSCSERSGHQLRGSADAGSGAPRWIDPCPSGSFFALR